MSEATDKAFYYYNSLEVSDPRRGLAWDRYCASKERDGAK